MSQKFRRNCSIPHRLEDRQNFVFCSFCEKIWNSKWQLFWVGQFFLDILEYLDTLWVKNFDEIALFRTVKKLAKILRLPFLRKIRKFKMAAILGEKFSLGFSEYLNTLWVKNFDEITLSRTIKELATILCFADFAKNSKIQNGCHFGREIFFWIF